MTKDAAGWDLRPMTEAEKEALRAEIDCNIAKRMKEIAQPWRGDVRYSAGCMVYIGNEFYIADCANKNCPPPDSAWHLFMKAAGTR